MICSVPVAHPETRTLRSMSSSVWNMWPLPFCLSPSTFLIISYSSKHTADTAIGTIHSGELCLCWYLSVLVCACDVVIRSQEKKITYCRVFVCLRVTGPCHSITGHTNLIIQLWAQWASVYERDGSPGENRAPSVTTLPFCSMTSCVWADSDSQRLFPRLITVGVNGLCFNLDTSPALVRYVCVNKRSRLASQKYVGPSEIWRMSRCDGGQGC